MRIEKFCFRVEKTIDFYNFGRCTCLSIFPTILIEYYRYCDEDKNEIVINNISIHFLKYRLVLIDTELPF